MTRNIILAALAALAILAATACGSNAPSPNLTSVYSKTFHSCQVSNLRWARHFEYTLPAPGTPADAAKLAAGYDPLCRDLAARAVRRAERAQR